jgi:hypothetical protein
LGHYSLKLGHYHGLAWSFKPSVQTPVPAVNDRHEFRKLSAETDRGSLLGYRDRIGLNDEMFGLIYRAQTTGCRSLFKRRQ